MSELSEADLDELIAQATVDCYNEDEELAGLAVMLEDNLAVPFETTVLGVPVTVRKIGQTESGIVAICVRGKHRQAILSRSEIGSGCWPAVSSWRQAARLYPLISPFSMDFRRIRWTSRLAAVTPGTSRSQPGIRWAMP